MNSKPCMKGKVSADVSPVATYKWQQIVELMVENVAKEYVNEFGFSDRVMNQIVSQSSMIGKVLNSNAGMVSNTYRRCRWVTNEQVHI